MNGRYTSSGMGLKIAGLVVPVRPGVAGRDVECARWSEAEDVWMGDAPPEAGLEAKAASSAFAFGDAGGSEAVELRASS